MSERAVPLARIEVSSSAWPGWHTVMPGVDPAGRGVTFVPASVALHEAGRMLKAVEQGHGSWRGIRVVYETGRLAFEWRAST